MAARRASGSFALFRERRDWKCPGARPSVRTLVAPVGRSGLGSIYSPPEPLVPNFLFQSIALGPGRDSASTPTWRVVVAFIRWGPGTRPLALCGGGEQAEGGL